MKEKETARFPWSLLFFVTSLSFFAFSGLVRLLGGLPDHAGMFLKIGMLSFGAGAVSFIGGYLIQILVSADENRFKKRR